MEDHSYSEEELERLSYRTLQQLAKSMALPSNVKKVFLIQLIHAKSNKSSAEVENIIERVKWERQQLGHTVRKRGKKQRVQAMEVSSTNICHSPPIDLTPKRPTPVKMEPDSTQRQPLTRCPQRQNTQPASDRVLRSYNVKTYKRPNYSLINNSVYEIVKVSEPERQVKMHDKEAQINIVSDKGKFPRVNVTARCVIRKYRPTILGGVSYLKKNLIVSQSVQSGNPSALAAVKRPRTEPPPAAPRVGVRRTDGGVSRIHALVQKQATYRGAITDNYRNMEVTIQDIINSNLRPPHPPSLTLPDSRGPSRSSSVDDQPRPEDSGSFSSYYHKKIRPEPYRNKRQITLPPEPFDLGLPKPYGPSIPNPFDPIPKPYEPNNPFDIPSNPYLKPYEPIPTYISKPFEPTYTRAEPTYMRAKPTYTPPEPTYMRAKPTYTPPEPTYMRTEPTYTRAEPALALPPKPEPRLPQICAAFCKFRGARDLTRPLYVHVSEESERIQNYPTSVARTSSLEGLYNYRSDFLAPLPLPLLTIATTNTTKSVYSTPVISSAVQQSMESADPFNSSYVEQASQYPVNTGVYEAIPEAEQDMTLRRYYEALNASSSSLDTSQELNDVNIPEMVEDALEIISQDGDYMERLGMDVKMQCILCSWAGPKIMLECHIRKEHYPQIIQVTSNKWNVTYKLSTLAQQPQWLSHVWERDAEFYALSVKYEDPDCLMAGLSTLSAEIEPMFGTITLYNKVTGEPFTWQGPVQEIASNMPYENTNSCLKIELSKLELLPNSANLKLLNRSLVTNSPSKVVVGQPELNDIHIIFFVEIENAL